VIITVDNKVFDTLIGKLKDVRAVMVETQVALELAEIALREAQMNVIGFHDLDTEGANQTIYYEALEKVRKVLGYTRQGAKT